MIAGVCGGLAKYFGMSEMAVRVIWAVGTLLTGMWLGIIVYVVLIFALKPE
jgi:phage shock protein C